MPSVTKHEGPHDDCEIAELHEHPVKSDTITIELGDNDKLFYAGVAAGAGAIDQLAEAGEVSPTEALTYFWLKVGTELGLKFPTASQDEAQYFIRGAGLRAPSMPEVPFQLTITSTDSAAFTPDPDQYDEETVSAEIVRILRTTADKMHYDGELQGPLHDANGNKVGTFEWKTGL